MANDGTAGAVVVTEDDDFDIDVEDEGKDVTEGAEPDDVEPKDGDECAVLIVLCRWYGVLHLLETNCCCVCCCQLLH